MHVLLGVSTNDGVDVGVVDDVNEDLDADNIACNLADELEIRWYVLAKIVASCPKTE